MKSTFTSLLLCVFTFAFLGCESKYVEKPPAQVEMVGPTVEERAEQKVTIDHDLVRIQSAIETVSNVVNRVGIHLNKDDQGGFVSLIQIVTNSLKELKEGMPQYYTDQLFARYASIKLPSLMKEECGPLDVALTTYPLMHEQRNIKIKKADRFGFFFKSCLTEEQFKPLFFVDSNTNKISIKFVTQNLEFISAELSNKSNQKSPQCSINYGVDSAVTWVQCSQLYLRFSPNRFSVIERIEFTPNSETVLMAIIVNYQDNIAVDQGFVLSIDRLGRVKTAAVKDKLAASNEE